MSLNVVTGGAGFVAFTLIDRLLRRGERVLALDDLSRGAEAHWQPFRENPGFHSAVVDCSDRNAFHAAVDAARPDGPISDIWHMAANSDIPAGIADPSIDLVQTFMTTFNAIQIAKAFSIPNFRFASSSAIYGDLGDIPIQEDVGPLEPISNYGAMKLASEAQIRAAVEASTMRADIFRFPNVVGVPATHGVMLDFIRKLKATPDTLEVLGNGTQQKIYLHVEELVDAMLFIAGRAAGRYNVFNIGPSDAGISVREIAEIVRDRVAPAAKIVYGTSAHGWVGDVPKFRYLTDKLSKLGWQPALDSPSAVRRAADQIAKQEAQAGWKD